jgi:hypothetical protein
MAACPFYRTDRIFVERRRKQRHADPVASTPEIAAPWCAHLYSPVSKYVATRIVGGANKLRCGGDLGSCEIPLALRPKR